MTKQEEHRLAVQAELDAAKQQAERNRMGQFATPTALALEMLDYAKSQLDENAEVRFIDPALGTGAFYSALVTVFPRGRVKSAVGYEIDPHYSEPAKRIWRDFPLDVRLEDFTLAAPPAKQGRFNLLICNPPYVRHHHIESSAKSRLRVQTLEASGIEVSGLAGLYCYFLGLSHPWMDEGGLAGWLIPSEFMDVNYGTAVKRYLLDRVTLQHIHRFDPNQVQFGDALVSSSVVWFSNRKPPHGHMVRMTFGGSLKEPIEDRLVSVETLRYNHKWTKYPMNEGLPDSHTAVLGDYFTIKRGLATGNNRYFILSAEEIVEKGLPIKAFRPILPSPRYLPGNEVRASGNGNPILEHRLFLMDFPVPEEEVREQFPSLWAYLEEGKALGMQGSYICRHRSPWYAQENRPPAPFLCTYLGRSDKRTGRPFRFILNHSNATAHNVYLLLYPKEPLKSALEVDPQLKWQVWDFLNSIDSKDMLGEGRVYGGGLHKLEPKELGRVPATALEDLLPQQGWWLDNEQLRLMERAAEFKHTSQETEGL